MGINIRPATINDSAAIGKVQLASWRTMFPEAGIDAEAYLAEFSDEERAEDWHDLFAANGSEIVYVAETDSGDVVGFILGELAPDELVGCECELNVIHILPAYRRQGIGRQLIASLAGHFKKAGAKSLRLWVLRGNRARQWYERLGGKQVAEVSKMIGKNEVGLEVSEVAYTWADINVLC